MMYRLGVPVRRRRGRARRRGFTLVELLVAMLVMTVGIIALASTAGVVTRMMTDGSRRTIAANVAQARFEKMRNLSCAMLASGSATTRRVHEVWVARKTAPTLTMVVDSVSFSTWSGQHASTLAYRSYVACH